MALCVSNHCVLKDKKLQLMVSVFNVLYTKWLAEMVFHVKDQTVILKIPSVPKEPASNVHYMKLQVKIELLVRD